MRIAVDISLYPLDADYVPPIKDFIERLNRASRPRRRDQRDEHAGGRRARRVFAALGAETRTHVRERSGAPCS